MEVALAGGGHQVMRALTAPVMGRDFMVIWVCTEDVWADLDHEGDAGLTGGIPWPVEDVRQLVGN